VYSLGFYFSIIQALRVFQNCLYLCFGGIFPKFEENLQSLLSIFNRVSSLLLSMNEENKEEGPGNSES
jgi:hypothetical protein